MLLAFAGIASAIGRRRVVVNRGRQLALPDQPEGECDRDWKKFAPSQDFDFIFCLFIFFFLTPCFSIIKSAQDEKCGLIILLW